MSTFENEKSKTMFFVSTFIDWYKTQDLIFEKRVFVAQIFQKNVYYGSCKP